MNNWIKATDQLPDYDTPVLWYTEDGQYHVEDLDKDGNPHLFGEDCGGYFIPPLTHWQYLPEPPKTNEEIISWDNPMDN